jgi:UDP-N-acetylmuramoyl-tripeptide--D-alanyl-D-alanine ligase
VIVASASLTLSDLLAASAGRLLGPADRALELDSVSIDSRTLAPGALFVAIKGPRFDGHEFLAAAAGRGARAALVERELAAPAGLALVRVADTRLALGELAREWRRRLAPPVVAVTGSVGKTTTKDMTARLLESLGPVLKTEGNLNNELGLPLTLLRLRPEHRAAVVELGMSAPGEIRALARLAVPEVAILTRVAAVHLEFFPSLDAIAEAKGEILEGLAAGGTAVLNRDDPRIVRLGERHAGRTLWFGREAGAEVRALNESHGPDDSRFRLQAGGRSLPVRLPLAGAHFVENFLAAAAAALALGVPLEVIAEAASSLAPARHRGELLRLGREVVLLDDCYNSSPEALRAALAALALLPGRRRVAVLGDMLELGTEGPALHRERGLSLAGSVDLLITVGALAEEIARGAREAGLAAEASRHFTAAAAAAAAVPALVESGDAVLIKGSRGVGLEAVVEALAAHLGTVVAGRA